MFKGILINNFDAHLCKVIWSRHFTVCVCVCAAQERCMRADSETWV